MLRLQMRNSSGGRRGGGSGPGPEDSPSSQLSLTAKEPRDDLGKNTGGLRLTTIEPTVK